MIRRAISGDTVEEPVVTKSAHIAEEVVIRKEGTDHVRTLRNKVRRHQMDVQRVPGTFRLPHDVR